MKIEKKDKKGKEKIENWIIKLINWMNREERKKRKGSERRIREKRKISEKRR